METQENLRGLWEPNSWGEGPAVASAEAVSTKFLFSANSPPRLATTPARADCQGPVLNPWLRHSSCRNVPVAKNCSVVSHLVENSNHVGSAAEFLLLAWAYWLHVAIWLASVQHGNIWTESAFDFCFTDVSPLQFNVLFSASIFFCIALNLMLVLVFNVNGRRMEKYYIIGSVVLSGACIGSAYASGRLGLDTAHHLCWFNNEDKDKMLRWVIATEMVWMLLLSAAELVVFFVVIGFLRTFIFDCTGTVARHSVDSESQTGSSTQWTIVTLRGIILRIGKPLRLLKEQAEGVPSFIRALQARRPTSQQTTQVPSSLCLSTFVDFSIQSTHGAESDLLGIGSEVENSSFNPAESMVGVKKVESMEGVAEPVAGPSLAAQWDVARQI
ncbi:hypothetical protein FB45DRAFT_1004810 [Roridomyces roridus]|uniref:Uncharacterized protein n=1 Tax=Roridomyces roridus TaxID=1738132 RepID=A0AAD7BQQ7_9AGAR|nr:hypothetical protein FB45DRAFT_1004810 [Roridomyces roridus]